MIKRIIPSSKESIPAMGIGSWIQFDVADNSNEIPSLESVLQLMSEHPGMMIDASPMYGRSEKVIGDLTQKSGKANDFFYATKVWIDGKKAGIEQMRDSLKLMQRKQMDLIQIHNMRDWKVHMETLKAWKAKGIIRYIGITHYEDEYHGELEKLIIKESAIDFVQFNYAIGNRHAEKRLLEVCRDEGVATIINRPLQKGQLFLKVRNKSLPVWATELGMKSWGQFFLKYILAHPAVTCIIPGTSDPAHMMDNIRAATGRLPEEDVLVKMRKLVDGL